MTRADIGRFTRLLHAIGALANQASPTSSAGIDLGHAFNRLRVEVRSALPPGLHEEFDRLHPAIENIPSGDLASRPAMLLANAGIVSTAQIRLTSLFGWLEGHIAWEKEAAPPR